MKRIFFILCLLVLSYPLGGWASAEDGKYVSIYGGYGLLSPNLIGDGFNYSLPAKGGSVFGFDAGYQPPEGTARYQLRYNKASSEHAAPSGITPSSLTMLREEYSFLFSFAPWDPGRFENLRLGVGFEFLRAGGTTTSAYEVFSRQTSQGPIFNIAYTLRFEPNWAVEGGFLLYLPHRISESSQVTGQNPNFIGSEFSLAAEYNVGENLTAFCGVKHRIDRVSYDGSATRGVSGGRDTRTQVAFPIGVKLGY